LLVGVFADGGDCVVFFGHVVMGLG
jgi:hypothetical protein